MRAYLDDCRETPEGFDVRYYSSIDAAVTMVQGNVPDFISFDHDLGGSDTAMILINWMIEMDMKLRGSFIPKNFDFQVHSANPVGAKSIESKLTNYLQCKRNNFWGWKDEEEE